MKAKKKATKKKAPSKRAKARRSPAAFAQKHALMLFALVQVLAEAEIDGVTFDGKMGVLIAHPMQGGNHAIGLLMTYLADCYRSNA